MNGYNEDFWKVLEELVNDSDGASRISYREAIYHLFLPAGLYCSEWLNNSYLSGKIILINRSL